MVSGRPWLCKLAIATAQKSTAIDVLFHRIRTAKSDSHKGRNLDFCLGFAWPHLGLITHSRGGLYPFRLPCLCLLTRLLPPWQVALVATVRESWDENVLCTCSMYQHRSTYCVEVPQFPWTRPPRCLCDDRPSYRRRSWVGEPSNRAKKIVPFLGLGQSSFSCLRIPLFFSFRSSFRAERKAETRCSLLPRPPSDFRCFNSLHDYDLRF